MAYSDFERLKEALRYELELWQALHTDYQTFLTKAKMNHGLSNVRLSQPQKDVLYQMYLDAAHRERAATARKA
jgi:hypothetical protein